MAEIPVTLLNDRFEILAEIGRGSQAATYHARDHQTGEEVALKELDFRRVEDWKAQELFEREGATLRALDHPAIPRYVEAFAVETDETVRLFLAQEFVDGPTLAEELARGRRWTESEIIADARLLLDALAYLHGRSPPVIHRDVKPSNIIRRSDGRLALVDFGAVQNVLPVTVGGSTVIGTPGYMPMEQLMGRAVPATDLYALGATLIHLLSTVAPSDLPLERNRLKFDDRVQCSPRLVGVLHKLTDPLVEDRYADASDVLNELKSSLEADTLPTRVDMPRRVDEPIDPSLFEADTVDPGTPQALAIVRRDRLTNTPGWDPPRMENGALVVDFTTLDVANYLLHVRVFDRADSVEVRARSPRRQRRIASGGSLFIAMTLAALAVGLPAVPFVILASVAIFAILPRLAPPPVVVDIHLDPHALRITKDHTIVFSGPAGAEWQAGRDGRLRCEGWNDVVLDVAPESEYDVAWLADYLNARTQELARVPALPPAESETRAEFWKEEPVEVGDR